MSEIKVDYAALVAASEDIRRTATAIETQLSDLRGYIAPMVATWTGAAAESYQATQQMWTKAQTDQQAVLLQMSQLVLAAHDGYQTAERGIAAAWRG